MHIDSMTSLIQKPMGSILPSKIRQVIEHSNLFAGLDPGVLDDVAASATKRSLRANELLFQKGDRADALWGVLSGRIIIEVRTDDGKEMLLDEFHSGDVFGEVGVLDFGPRMVEAAAACDSELFRLERSYFLEHLQTNPELCFRVFSLLCGHLRDTTETLEDTALYRLPNRLAKRLISMAHEASQDNDCAVLKIVQADLARMMGVHREAINRQLKAWEKSGWISIRRQRIEILEESSLAGLAAPGQTGNHDDWGNDRHSRLTPIAFPANRAGETKTSLPELRLAGIMAISCTEYAAMLMTDSAGTVKRIKDGLAAIDRSIKAHGGRVIWSAGERTLAEFSSASSAVSTALAIQKQAGEPGVNERRKNSIFRIGIHFGEVFISDDRTMGNPVNVAIRLTELPGSSSICLTGEVRDALGDTGGLELHYLGKHELKKIDNPVSVYSVRSVSWLKQMATWANAFVPRRFRPALTLLAALALLTVIWLSGQRFGEDREPIPSAHSIAVMSFTLEDNSTDAYLADGLADEIRIALARIPQALVIGKQSSAYFEEWNATGQEIGEILKVAYVLQGTVGVIDDELRVSSRLVETGNGTEIWHSNFQGSWQDFSNFQTEIIRLTHQSLNVGADDHNLKVASIQNRDAFTLYLQALELYETHTKASLMAALEKLKAAIRIEPDFAPAHIAAARTYLDLSDFSGYYQNDWLQESRELAGPHVEKALEIDSNLAEAHLVRGNLLAYADSEQEELAYRKAVSLNPNLAEAQLELGIRLCNQLRSLNDCLPYLEKALTIEPLSIDAAVTLALFLQYVPQRREEARSIMSNLKDHNPDHQVVNEVDALWLLEEGRLAEAVPLLEKNLVRDPDSVWAKVFLKSAWLSLGETERALESPDLLLHWQYVLSPDREGSLTKMKEYKNNRWARGGVAAYIYVMLRDWQSTVEVMAEPYETGEQLTGAHVEMMGKNYSPALSLATAYKAMGDEKNYRKFAELEKEAVKIRWANDGYHNVNYLRNLARLYALEGRNFDALGKLELLINTGPVDPRELLHPAFDGMRDDPRFERLYDKQRRRVNAERVKLGLVPLPKQAAFRVAAKMH